MSIAKSVTTSHLIKRCPHCGVEQALGSALCVACSRPIETGPDPYAGKVLLGKYRCIDRVGSGATSWVYKAQHAKIGQLRAIKLLRPELKNDPRAVEAFWHEARVAACFRHANVVMLHDVDALPDTTPCSIWEYIEGQTLEERVRAQPLGSDTATVIRGLCGALETLHARGYAHLDLCPQNVLVGVGEGALEARLIDFGETQKEGAPAERTLEDLRLGFSAPEQVLGGGTVDARADVFAMGALICFCFTGHPPLAPRDLGSYAEELRRLTDPSRLRVLAGLPPSLRVVVERCLAREPGDRPENAAALRDAVRRAARESGTIASPVTAVNPAPAPPAVPVQTPPPRPATVASGAADAFLPPPRGAASRAEATTASRPALRVPQPDESESGATPASTGRRMSTPFPGTVVDSPETYEMSTLELPAAAAAAQALRIQAHQASRPPARLEPLVAGLRPIDLGTVTLLGRGEEATALVDHPTVSKRHARVSFQNGAYLFEELGSRNGSSINGRRVAVATALKDGDKVALGEVVFRLRIAPG